MKTFTHRWFGPVLAVLLCGIGMASAQRTSGDQKYFDSPAAAVDALVAALGTNDSAALVAILGPAYEAHRATVDDAVEQANRDRVAKMADQIRRIEARSGSESIVLFGYELWPFPAPIVLESARWRFDTERGLEEILRRRIGENELNVIDVCREYILAQREYASEDRDGDGVLEYAQRILSNPGTRDGLYWDAGPGDERSPLGPLLANAETAAKAGEGYMGYRYKILTAQGEAAPGRRYSYVDDGNMTHGFALVAWPVEYGQSGVMTFIVNHLGAVYENDLGEKSEKSAGSMARFDPDAKWVLVVD
jgi:hypothetical protein